LTGSLNDIPTSWSPDGFNISYYSNVTGSYDLFFVNTAGGVQQVTKNAGNNVGGAWGPDSTHIAFLSDRDGTWSLYIAQYNGTEATKIAIAPQGDWQRQRVSWVP
jgi:Tol biopolymer transport system component